MATVPWFLPGVAASLVIAGALAGPVGRATGIGPRVTFLLMVSLGLIGAATLTPLSGALEFGIGSPRACDLTRIGPAPLATYLRPNETSLNVALFVPLGIAVSLVQPRRVQAALILLGLALPLAVETAQLWLSPLGRGCEAADVFDNTAGLLVGLVIGKVGLYAVRRGVGGVGPRIEPHP